METSAQHREWEEVIGEQAKSGKTIREFCSERRIPEHRYYYWRRKVAGSSWADGFTELVGFSGRHPLLEIQVNRVQLTFYQPVSANSVRGLLHVIREG